MYRAVLQPTSADISISIPPSWLGRNVEIIVFPLVDGPQEPVAPDKNRDNTAKRMSMDKKFLFSTKDFKFNRDEANDYD
jgi:hypothetical protein